MNEAKLKGMFLKELYKGRFTNILLFYDEQEGMLAVGVDKEKDITFKEDCLITVSVKGRVKQTKSGMVMYENHLHLRGCEYSLNID